VFIKKIKKMENKNILQNIRQLITLARVSVSKHVNSTMTLTYFLVGRYIVLEEQNGKERAEYSKKTLEFLSENLTQEFGKGFSTDNLENMRRFFIEYKEQSYISDILNLIEISETQSRISDKINENQFFVEIFRKMSYISSSRNMIHKENSEKLSRNLDNKLELQEITSKKLVNPFILSWSHYLVLSRIKNKEERNFYEIEAINNDWTLKELERQFDSSLYERLVLSRNKKKVKQLSEVGQIIEKAEDAIKNPLVVEFLGLKEDNSYSETDLETAIINKLEHFLLELGKGFLFAGRQQRFTFEEEHFFVDLVFYNRLLKCFVLVDLKIGKLKHQDIGQMQMYVNYYDRFVKNKDENKTIGIIVCKDKKDAIIELTLPENNEQIFASEYKLYLPSKEELKQLIENKF